YETIFVVNPTLGEEDYKEVLKKYSALVERQKGILVRVEEWGRAGVCLVFLVNLCFIRIVFVVGGAAPPPHLPNA
ncbi:MAG: 30S ribosomal protein S6, partial [Pseudanabaena sp.]